MMGRWDRTTRGENGPFSTGGELALVSLLYLLLTAVLTYPTLIRLRTHIPGSGDAPRMVWDMWAFARAVTDPLVSLSITDLIHYPLPGVPTMWEGTPSLFFGVPLEFLLGPIVSYNLAFLLSFVLSGLFTYALARHLSVSRVASFLAGAVFSFSAYHYAHGTGHMHIFSTQWLPLCLLSLLLLWERPGIARTVHLAIAMVLIVVDSPYYALYFLAPVLVCFFVYQMWKDRARLLERRFLGGLFLAMAVAAASAFVVYPRLFFPDPGTAAALVRDAADTERYSADVLAYLLPSPTHPAFGQLVAPIYARFTAPENAAEMTVYVGFCALLLAIWGLRVRRRTASGFWALLALVGLALSLGPVLHVGGKRVLTLPYAIMTRLPAFGALRAPSRASATLLLSVAVLAGYGLSDLLDKIRSRDQARVVVGASVLLLVLFESLYSYPFQSSSVAVPAFYEEVRNDSGCQALFELPTGPGHDASTAWYMLYQTYHGERLAHGYLARQPESEILFPYWVLRGKFLSPPLELPAGDTWPAFEASFSELLAFNHVTCVVAQQQAGPFAVRYSDEEYRELKATLARSLGDPIYDDEGLVAHDVSPLTPQVRASFSGKVELVHHKLVETTSCPGDAGGCTFLVTFWRVTVAEPKEYGLHAEIQRQDKDEVLAWTAHSMGYQFTVGEEVAIYNTSWWSPGVIVTDYTLLPSTSSEGEALSEPMDIWVRVTEPSRGITLQGQSDRYPVDEQGRLLIGSYNPLAALTGVAARESAPET